MKSTLQLLKTILFLFFVTIISDKLYSQAGTLDESFGNNGSTKSSVKSFNSAYCKGLIELTSHKIVSLEESEVGGVNQHSNLTLYCYKENGSLDKTFGKNGKCKVLADRKTKIIYNRHKT